MLGFPFLKRILRRVWSRTIQYTLEADPSGPRRVIHTEYPPALLNLCHFQILYDTILRTPHVRDHTMISVQFTTFSVRDVISPVCPIKLRASGTVLVLCVAYLPISFQWSMKGKYMCVKGNILCQNYAFSERYKVRLKEPHSPAIPTPWFAARGAGGTNISN